MPYEAVSFPIGGKDVYRGLIVLYCLIALYSALAVYFGAQTVEQATNPAYGAVFPIALFFCALAALYGVVRSRYTRRVWLEYAGTVLLLAGLMGYTCAIVWAATSLHEPWRVPGAVLPVMVSVFPTLRLRNILKVVKVHAKQRAARKLGIVGVPGEHP
jgi:peptidoglycan/LPS O-acetylase OafA/YrhL